MIERLHLDHVFPGGSNGKASAYNAGDLGLIPGSGRSPGEGNGDPLQYSCLENPMDGVAWWAPVHGVAKSWTQLSDFTFLSLSGIERQSHGLSGFQDAKCTSKYLSCSRNDCPSRPEQSEEILHLVFCPIPLVIMLLCPYYLMINFSSEC